MDGAKLSAIDTVWMRSGDIKLVIPFEVIKFLDHGSVFIMSEYQDISPLE